MNESAASVRRESKNAYMIMGSLLLCLCWLQVTTINITISPLMYISKLSGVSTAAADSFFLLSMAAGVLIYILFISDQVVKYALAAGQAVWVGAYAYLMFVRNPQVFVTLDIVLGFLTGIILACLIYTAVFFVLHIPWVRLVAIFYFAMRGLVYIYILVDLCVMLVPAYVCSILPQVLCMLTALLFSGTIIEVRQKIPEEHFAIKSMLMPLLLSGLILTFSIVKDVIEPAITDRTGSDYFEIVPIALTLLYLFLGGQAAMGRFHVDRHNTLRPDVYLFSGFFRQPGYNLHSRCILAAGSAFS